MDQQLDGVKVTVNNEEGENKKQANQAKKKPAAKKTSSEQNEKKPKKENKGGLMSMLMSTIVVAIVVGGGIYFWQHQVSTKNVDKVKEEAKSSRMDFEQRLNNLKDKITGMEKENADLKSASDALKTNEELLAKAKLDYKNDELGLSFTYPASLGQVELTVAGGDKGKLFKGSFSKTDKIMFSGVTKDYSSASTTASTSVSFMETTGFLDKDKKFYFQPATTSESTDLEIKPIKSIASKNGQVLLVDKKSLIPAANGKTVDIGENIGAIFNLKNKSFTGVAFLVQDLGVLSLPGFEEMLKTIEVK